MVAELEFSPEFDERCAMTSSHWLLNRTSTGRNRIAHAVDQNLGRRRRELEPSPASLKRRDDFFACGILNTVREMVEFRRR